jgi:hypothetical protein
MLFCAWTAKEAFLAKVIDSRWYSGGVALQVRIRQAASSWLSKLPCMEGWAASGCPQH